MTVNELITLFRRSAEDSAYTHDRDMPESFSLWSNYQLIHFIDQAQKDFAEKTYIFRDDQNFNIIVETGIPNVSLDERVLRIERAELLSSNHLLAVKSIEEFQNSTGQDDYGVSRHASWEERTGTPDVLITDINSGYARIYPIPEADDEIKLTVRRLPLIDLVDLDEELEIPSRYQFGLLYKVQIEAFSSPKALLMGYGDALVAAKEKWEDFLIQAHKQVRVRTRGPGKTRYYSL